MQRKLLYLVNPISGTRKKAVLRQIITAKTERAGFAFEIADTRADGDYAAVRERVVNENITDVIVCGGDGSVSTVTSHLLKTDTRIGIIPMGSGNGLAFAAGIPFSSARALDVILKGHAAFIDGFYINDRFSCMMCGIGSDAQVAHDFAAQKIRGLGTYLKLSALNYFRSKPFSFSIHTAAGKFSTEAFFITVANSNQFGNHVTIAPSASLSDGLLDVVVVKKMHKLILPFALLNQIAGVNLPLEIGQDRKNKNVIYFQVSEAVIVNEGGAPVHIDGEPFPSSKKIRVKVLPNAFRLIRPSSSLPASNPGKR